MPSQAIRTASPAAAAASTSPRLGMRRATGRSSPRAGDSAPADIAAPSTARTISVAAGSVARAQPGSSITTTAALATQASPAAAGIAPCRRAASRRRGVAGIVRSAESDMRV